jgi:hypothetical protein
MQLKIEDMKIILENQQQQDAQERQQQQFIIVQSQSLAGKNKLGAEDAADAQDEIVYVLKDEATVEQPNVIQLDSNCVNQEQFVWITNNDQSADGNVQNATTMYTIKEVNYSQVTPPLRHYSELANIFILIFSLNINLFIFLIQICGNLLMIFFLNFHSMTSLQKIFHFLYKSLIFF